MFFGSPLIGLDVGSGMLKAATLRRKDGRIVVQRAGLAATPSGAMLGRKLLDPPAIAASVRRLCNDIRLRGRHVAVAVGGADTFHHVLKVERKLLPNAEAVIREEAARLVPFAPEEALLDFEVLDLAPAARFVDAVVVAARQRSVDGLQRVLERAGKKAAIVDSTACALANVFEANYAPSPTEITGMLHLGAATMTLSILRGPVPQMVRDLTLDNAVPWREQPSPAERVAVEVERFLEHMDEIADEHPLEPRSRDIGRIMLSGGGIRLRGLEEILRARLRIPLEELNPFLRIEYPGAGPLARLVWDHSHCMAVAVGLALRGLAAPTLRPGMPR